MPLPLPRSFRSLSLANLAAQSAEQISLAAVPIVAVLALGAGPGAVGTLASVQTLPFLLLSIPIGLLVDRWSRQRLMRAAEAVRSLTLALLAWAAWHGTVSMPLLLVLGFLGAMGTVGFNVAAPALVPALAPREALAAANGRLELARSLAYAGGPALAGLLVSWAGAPVAFAAAFALSAAAVVWMARVHEPARPPAPPRHPLAELREGAQRVWGHALLRPVLLTATLWNLAWFVLQAAYVPYAMSRLGLDAAGVGLTLAAYGGGMVVGALLAPRAIRAVPYGAAVIVGPVASVLASSLMLSSLAWPTPWLAAASMAVFGAGPILWTITSTTLRQTVTPPRMLGRVGAIFLTVNAGVRPLGAALGALVGARWGTEACLTLSTAVFVAQALVIVSSPVRVLRRLPVAAGAQA